MGGDSLHRYRQLVRVAATGPLVGHCSLKLAGHNDSSERRVSMRTWWTRSHPTGCCRKIAEAEAAVSVNERKWLVMHMHVQLKLDELRGPPNPWLTVT